MTEPNDLSYKTLIGFKAPDDFVVRLNQFSRKIGRNRSAVARYLIGQCLNAYEDDQAAMVRIRHEIL